MKSFIKAAEELQNLKMWKFEDLKMKIVYVINRFITVAKFEMWEFEDLKMKKSCFLNRRY
jgi:hypothetical protein